MAYQPLTQEQYQTARKQFSADQIIQFEQKRKESASANVPPTPTSDIQLQQNQENEAANKLGFTPLGRAVFKPVIGFGGSIAGALSNILPKSWTGVGDVDKAQKSYSEDTNSLINLIKDRRSKGMDTSSLEKALKNEVPPAQWKDLYASITKNAKQVAGEAAGTGLLALSGGGLSAGGAAESGVLAASKAVVPSLTRTIAAGATVGAISGASNAAQDNKSIGDIAKSGLTSATVGAATGGITYGLGKLVQATGNKILNSVIKPSKADIEDGFSMDTVKKYNLGGSLDKMAEKTDAKLNSLTKQLNEKLAGSDSSIDIAKVYDDTVASLSKNQLKSFGSNTSVDNALEQLQNEVLTVNPSGKMSIPDSQIVKQASGRMGAWQFGVTDPESTARETVYNAFYKNLKQDIEDNSPEGVKEINKQISELIPISHAIIRRIPVASRNATLSLSDMVSLTAGLANPHTLPAFIASVAQKSGSVGNVLSKLGPEITKQSARVGAASGYGTGKLTGN